MKQDSDSNYNFLLTGTATHVGQVRKANEDNMTVFETANMKVFVVCDGMGGHVGGKVASETAIKAICDFLINNITVDPREAIYNAIVAANEALLEYTRRQPELAGMGSTCVMLIVTSDGKVYYGHVGDSRIYIIANHRITQLTEDHSVVYEMYKSGIIKTREEMERHPRKNEITNALGLQGMKPPTICNTPIEPEAGNCFLLCSDGLTGMVGDEPIQRVISKHEIPIQQRAEKLIQMANDNGGVDNITVELVEFAIATRQINNGKTQKPKKWGKIIIFIAAALILSAATAFGVMKFLSKEKPTEEDTTISTTATDATSPQDTLKNNSSVPEEVPQPTETPTTIPPTTIPPTTVPPATAPSTTAPVVYVMMVDINTAITLPGENINIMDFKEISEEMKALWKKDNLKSIKAEPSSVKATIKNKIISIAWTGKEKLPKKIVLSVSGKENVYKIAFNNIVEKPVVEKPKEEEKPNANSEPPPSEEPPKDTNTEEPQ